ncbi:MAG: TolC family protein [Candidatus Omnitrophica bacterium]|nr:TolC family protein [Candidatus Omnitrophota bacterium]
MKIRTDISSPVSSGQSIRSSFSPVVAGRWLVLLLILAGLAPARAENSQLPSASSAADAAPSAIRVEVAAIHEDSEGLTLQDCYRLALKRSESVAIREEIINETKGQMMQSLSTALPRVAFAYSEKWQDAEGRRNVSGSEPEGKFTFTQPLFTGFKEIAAIRASKHVGQQREEELKRARQLLFVDVSDAFFLYISYQEDEQALQDIHKALLDRLADLKKRETIGKSRQSELASAEAKLSRNEAELETVRGEKEVAGQLLEFLLGRPVVRLLDIGDPDATVAVGDASSLADRRSDVLAAREAKESLKQNLFATRSALWPSVSLTGNAYTKRPDGYESNDWDATLTVSVPIFNGLYDYGQIRQARSQLIQADLAMEQARRVAVLEIRNAYSKWQTNGRRVTALEKAMNAAERNFFLQIEDFQKNLVNNLDVLQALEDLQGVRRDYIAAKTDARRSYWALKVAIGEVMQ